MVTTYHSRLRSRDALFRVLERLYDTIVDNQMQIEKSQVVVRLVEVCNGLINEVEAEKLREQIKELENEAKQLGCIDLADVAVTREREAPELE